jgi:hypothetical protein
MQQYALNNSHRSAKKVVQTLAGPLLVLVLISMQSEEKNIQEQPWRLSAEMKIESQWTLAR